MGLIRDEDAAEIREQLKAMVNPVKLVHFTQELNLEYGRETKQLIEELALLSDKLSVEVYNFLLDKEKVAKKAKKDKGTKDDSKGKQGKEKGGVLVERLTHGIDDSLKDLIYQLLDAGLF